MPAVTQPTKLQSFPASRGADAVYKAYREDGGVIIKGLLTPEQVDSMNADIQPAMDALQAGSKFKEEWVKEFHGSNTKRLTNLFSLSRDFRQHILDNDMVYDVCDKVFLEESGSYWMTTAQVIEIGPGNAAQPLHRDQTMFPVWTSLGPSAPEAVVNFFIALTSFTDENGATRVIPGSHKWPDFSEYGSQADTQPVEMEPGDAFFFGGKVVHGGGENRTADFHRRGVAFAVQCSYLTPEEASPLIADFDLVKQASPRVQAMLGFRSQKPKDSAGLWTHNYGEIATHLGLDSKAA